MKCVECNDFEGVEVPVSLTVRVADTVTEIVADEICVDCIETAVARTLMESPAMPTTEDAPEAGPE